MAICSKQCEVKVKTDKVVSNSNYCPQELHVVGFCESLIDYGNVVKAHVNNADTARTQKPRP